MEDIAHCLLLKIQQIALREVAAKSRVVLRIQTFGAAGGIWNLEREMYSQMWHSIQAA